MIKVHGTSVDIEGKGVLLRGLPGSGKSDLALRLIEGGANLISDDYTEIHVFEKSALLGAPPTIQGKIEVRGIGLVEMPFVDNIPLQLIFDLVPYEQIERMPADEFYTIENLEIPVRYIDPFMASAAAKVRIAIGLEYLKTGYE
ncbi:HPr kinase/phosphatase C-terminal domain-containing protein [Sneathiella marina]|uniref:HPr kinase/phosphatase C-terminal domain-containing protein n=1 Tax=Sneathiella marina TaxID=2950108 RepID=A0ABY4W2P9_9PROT|nr:HPr kinase/phosphatase C-terminal domain-containing protein [Sneathiella marina]USG61338.1 HPr kinase/phosphatase C-terminal domain-containing protein [Sneathiella marina]